MENQRTNLLEGKNPRLKCLAPDPLHAEGQLSLGHDLDPDEHGQHQGRERAHHRTDHVAQLLPLEGDLQQQERVPKIPVLRTRSLCIVRKTWKAGDTRSSCRS